MPDQLKYKRTLEDFDFTFSFADKLASTETVDTVANGSSVTAKKPDGTTDNTIIGTVTPTSQSLKAHLTGGTDQEDYTVTFHAKATTSGDEYEKVLELRVRNDIVGGF